MYDSRQPFARFLNYQNLVILKIKRPASLRVIFLSTETEETTHITIHGYGIMKRTRYLLGESFQPQSNFRNFWDEKRSQNIKHDQWRHDPVEPKE